MSSQWYLYKDGRQQGPFSWEELYRQAEAGLFGPADLVWTEGMENWERADRIRGLFVMAPAPSASSPAPPSSAFNNKAPSIRSKGRGMLIALIIILVVLVLGGGLFAFNLLLAGGAGRIERALSDLTGGEGIRAPSGLPPDVITGSWQEEGKAHEEIYMQFKDDETFILAVINPDAPEESYWLQFQYRLIEENGSFIIEKSLPEDETWHDSAMRVEILASDRLRLENILLGDSGYLNRIDDQLFDEITDPLEEMTFIQDVIDPDP